jgi:hypothetical protein
MVAFLRALVTGDDQRHADEMAILSILGVLAFIGLSAYAVIWKGQAWDPQAYGIGLGAAIGAAAMGMGIKARGEREKEGA